MFPILIQAGPWPVRSYVVLMGLAAIVSLWYLWRLGPRFGTADRQDFWFLANLIGLSGFAGGRLLASLLHRGSPDAPGFWHAWIYSRDGPPTFGVIIGVIAGACLYSRSRAAPGLRTLDRVFLVVPLGHGIARLGCFMNGCCYGRLAPGHVPWAVVLPIRNRKPLWRSGACRFIRRSFMRRRVISSSLARFVIGFGPRSKRGVGATE